MKKDFSIKQIALYGFLLVLIGAVFTSSLIFIFIDKIENLNHKKDYFETIYDQTFENKYYTERLLTTHNLSKEKNLWIESRKKLQKSLSNFNIEDKKKQNTILDFWKVIESESIKIDMQLNNKLFKEQNIMEKSILRRLGEGLNSNEKSDYYIALANLKNSIDYLKQYEEFLLDEITEIKTKQSTNIFLKIDQTKETGVISFLVISILAITSIYYILKLIGRVEKDLIITKENLQDTLEETNYILDAAMESIFISKGGICLDVNKSALSTFGYKSKEEMIGRPLTDFVAPESLEDVKENHDLDMAKPYEIFCTKQDLTRFPVVVQGHNFRNKNKEKIRISALVDLSDIKAKDEMLFKQSKMASMGEMLENIAHQWRQPLSVISSAASGLQMKREFGMSNEKEEIETLEMITKSVQHLSQTIEDFRSFFKQDKQKKHFSLSTAFKRSEELLSSKFKNRNIKLIKDFEDIEILGFENEMVQAFMNILTNAKDALSENEIKDKIILISIKREEDYIIIKIIDNAGGVPENILPKVFDKHFTTKGDEKGTGIGLYMTKMIIEKLNGRIEVINSTFENDDKSLKGACFSIILPSA